MKTSLDHAGFFLPSLLTKKISFKILFWIVTKSSLTLVSYFLYLEKFWIENKKLPSFCVVKLNQEASLHSVVHFSRLRLIDWTSKTLKSDLGWEKSWKIQILQFFQLDQSSRLSRNNILIISFTFTVFIYFSFRA